MQDDSWGTQKLCHMVSKVKKEGEEISFLNENSHKNEVSPICKFNTLGPVVQKSISLTLG